MSKALKKKQVLVGQFDIGGSGSQVLDGGGGGSSLGLEWSALSEVVLVIDKNVFCECYLTPPAIPLKTWQEQQGDNSKGNI